MNDLQKNIEKVYEKFLQDQIDFFEDTHVLMSETNHEEQFLNANYWNIISNITNFPTFWKGKTALDFGCGCGRNIKMLLDIAEWERVDGCDISGKNAVFAKKYVNSFHKNKCNVWRNDGFTILDKENEYDFIMSTVVFQHIPVYDIRYSLLSDMYRLLKPKGLLSIQFEDMDNSVSYFENKSDFDPLNTNCRVEKMQYIMDDLTKIGFSILEMTISKIDNPTMWYIIKATKE